MVTNDERKYALNEVGDVVFGMKLLTFLYAFESSSLNFEQGAYLPLKVCHLSGLRRSFVAGNVNQS